MFHRTVLRALNQTQFKLPASSTLKDCIKVHHKPVPAHAHGYRHLTHSCRMRQPSK